MEADYHEFVAAVTEILEKCGAQYAIGGSFASMMYGEMRLTYDVDITVQLSVDKAPCLAVAFKEREWYVLLEEVERALKRGIEFNTYDPSTGYKADFFVTPLNPTPRQERVLARRQLQAFGEGKSAYFMAVEDVILYKLEWFLMGKSDKHLRDVGAMLTAKQLDLAYIEREAAQLNLTELWRKVYQKHQENKHE